MVLMEEPVLCLLRSRSDRMQARRRKKRRLREEYVLNRDSAYSVGMVNTAQSVTATTEAAVLPVGSRTLISPNISSLCSFATSLPCTITATVPSLMWKNLEFGWLSARMTCPGVNVFKAPPANSRCMSRSVSSLCWLSKSSPPVCSMHFDPFTETSSPPPPRGSRISDVRYMSFSSIAVACARYDSNALLGVMVGSVSRAR
mmetsp:Transcript_11589/g.29270  ORF Transcript_11589/g.29270 Transcript_11589/m.29270 type:complete len:201 (+) Transcript_11589:881-1483(+)